MAANMSPNLELPFIAYGLLKSSELGFRQISPHVTESIAIALPGYSLQVIDGVAFAIQDEKGLLKAEKLSFSASASAYKAIESFEGLNSSSPRYRWSEATVGGQVCNILVAKSRVQGLPPSEAWASSDDPVFTQGIPWLRSEIRESIEELRENAISDPKREVYWSAYFRLQASLLVMWGVQERLEQSIFGVEAAYGSIGKRRKWFKGLPEFKKALDWAEIDLDLKVQDYRAPGGASYSSLHDPMSCWYQLRNNITHHGKGSEREVMKVATAAVDHFNTLLAFLELNSKTIAKTWDGLTFLPKSLYSSRLY